MVDLTSKRPERSQGDRRQGGNNTYMYELIGKMVIERCSVHPQSSLVHLLPDVHVNSNPAF